MARGSTYLWPGFTLETSSDGQVVESGLRVPDESWRYVDDLGHGHFYTAGYPTLDRVEPGCTMGHGDDCPGDAYYVCRTCGQRVIPGTKDDPPRWVPGLASYTLTSTVEPGVTRVWRFGPDRWTTLNDMVQVAIADALGDPDEMTYHGGSS